MTSAQNRQPLLNGNKSEGTFIVNCQCRDKKGKTEEYDEVL